MKKSIFLLLTFTLSPIILNTACHPQKQNPKNQLFGQVKEVQTNYADSTLHIDAFDKDGDILYCKDISDDTAITYYNKEGLPEKIIILGNQDTIHSISEKISPNKFKFCLDKDSVYFSIYIYDENQKLIEKQIITNDNQVILQENFQYENNCLTQQKTINEEQEQNISQFTYDRQNRLSKECSANGKTILEYQYKETDNQGNWTKRSYILDGTEYTDTRTIIYWN